MRLSSRSELKQFLLNRLNDDVDLASPAVENRWISCASNGLTVAAQDA